jgi:hypothetical protein
MCYLKVQEKNITTNRVYAMLANKMCTFKLLSCNPPHLERDQILFEEAPAFDEQLSALVYLKKSFSEY